MNYTKRDFYNLNLQENGSSILKPIKWLMKLYYSVLLFWGCLKIIKNPYNTDVVIRAAQGLATPERFKESQEYLSSLPGAVEIFRDKPKFSKFDLAQLQKLPPDTLGFHYAQHMIRNNLDPNFFDVEFQDNITYAFYRYGKIHDILHVVTGFDTSIAGEVGILSYTYSQSKGPGALMIASLAFLHGVLVAPEKVSAFVDAFISGWILGQRSEPYFTAPWEELLKLPLVEVRTKMNIDFKKSNSKNFLADLN